MTPSSDKKRPRVQRTAVSLEDFSDVTLIKEFDFTPVANAEEAQARLNGDAKLFLAILNEGLLAETRRKAGEDSNPWYTEDDEGNLVAYTGKAIVGKEASKVVNSIVLTLAKTAFGYIKDATAEAKASAKKQAMEFIKASPVLLDGLKQRAAEASTADES